MKFLIYPALVALLLTILLDARYLQKKASVPAVLEFPIKKLDRAKTSEYSLIRRSKSFTANARNLGTYFATEVFVGRSGDDGASAQSITLQWDTGNSIIWMNSPSNPICKEGNECSNYGTFNPYLSATKASGQRKSFSFSYDSGEKGSGYICKDRLRIDGLQLDEIEFGLVTSSNTGLGAIGLGYYSLQKYWIGIRGFKDTAIPTFPQVLVAKGIINLQAYSIFLNSESAHTGSIIFGGVDTSKFNGGLSTMPVQKERGDYLELLVRLDSVSHAGKTSSPIDALLDIGNTLTFLQDDVAKSISISLNAEYDHETQIPYVSCGLKKSKQTIKFSFSQKIIQVPVGSFILEPDPNLPFASHRTGETLCRFGLEGLKMSEQAILGTGFMRSIYAVFDLTNNEISIAQASYPSSGSSNIIEIPREGVSALDLVGLGTNDPSTSDITADLSFPDSSLPSDDDPFSEQPQPNPETSQPTTPNPNQPNQLASLPSSSTDEELGELPDQPISNPSPFLRSPQQGDLALPPGVQNFESQSTQQQQPDNTPNTDQNPSSPSSPVDENTQISPRPEGTAANNNFDQPPNVGADADEVDPGDDANGGSLGLGRWWKRREGGE